MMTAIVIAIISIIVVAAAKTKSCITAPVALFIFACCCRIPAKLEKLSAGEVVDPAACGLSFCQCFRTTTAKHYKTICAAANDGRVVDVPYGKHANNAVGVCDKPQSGVLVRE